MSNTPRTNAATVRMERLDGDIDEVVSADFARTLERELIATRSATGEPVAWMYEEHGERMFGHPDGYRPLGAVPLYAGSPPVEEKAIGHALNTLDIIANWGDEENEWDAVVKYRSVRDRAATHVAILRSPMKGEKPE